MSLYHCYGGHLWLYHCHGGHLWIFHCYRAQNFFFYQGPEISLAGPGKINLIASFHDMQVAEIRPWVITIKVAKLSSSIFEWTLLFHFPPVFTLILPTLICFVFLQVHITLFLSVPLYQYNFYVLQFLVKTSGNKLVIWYEIWQYFISTIFYAR